MPPSTQTGSPQTKSIAIAAVKIREEKKGIPQSDLRERVFKREVGLGAVRRSQEDAQRNQEKRAPERMRKHLSIRAAFGEP